MLSVSGSRAGSIQAVRSKKQTTTSSYSTPTSTSLSRRPSRPLPLPTCLRPRTLGDEIGSSTATVDESFGNAHHPTNCMCVDLSEHHKHIQIYRLPRIFQAAPSPSPGSSTQQTKTQHIQAATHLPRGSTHQALRSSFSTAWAAASTPEFGACLQQIKNEPMYWRLPISRIFSAFHLLLLLNIDIRSERPSSFTRSAKPSSSRSSRPPSNLPRTRNYIYIWRL